MANNLVVIVGPNICFSNFIRKENGLFNKCDLSTFISVVENSFRIPINEYHMDSLLEDFKQITTFSTLPVKNGPMFIEIYENHFNEVRLFKNNPSCLALATRRDSFYVRSDDGDLESAATAAAMIYKKPEIIYKEAMKAREVVCPIFYKANVFDLTRGVNKFHEWDKELVLNLENTSISESQRQVTAMILIDKFKENIIKVKEILGIEQCII